MQNSKYGFEYYKELEVSKDATIKEIKKKYHSLAKIYHPDRNPDGSTEEKYAKIKEAFGVLNDEEKKKEYDEFLNKKFRQLERVNKMEKTRKRKLKDLEIKEAEAKRQRLMKEKERQEYIYKLNQMKENARKELLKKEKQKLKEQKRKEQQRQQEEEEIENHMIMGRWNKQLGTYSLPQLESIFSPYGSIIVLKYISKDLNSKFFLLYKNKVDAIKLMSKVQFDNKILGDSFCAIKIKWANPLVSPDISESSLLDGNDYKKNIHNFSSFSDLRSHVNHNFNFQNNNNNNNNQDYNEEILNEEENVYIPSIQEHQKLEKEILNRLKTFSNLQNENKLIL
eukprot:TRINITY_DN1309_c1_g2_i1.p1 TRINITY_DN1309_c1_g2~~TRINITY_DN1309_c1_g2_i1.p1  ORF type:complete len:346 (-),score=107.47 TRINITY_DN1309_c1_g2_i1:20-1033(-)